MTILEKKIAQLPPELQQEVENFVESLLRTKSTPKQKKLRMTWAGAERV